MPRRYAARAGSRPMTAIPVAVSPCLFASRASSAYRRRHRCERGNIERARELAVVRRRDGDHRPARARGNRAVHRSGDGLSDESNVVGVIEHRVARREHEPAPGHSLRRKHRGRLRAPRERAIRRDNGFDHGLRVARERELGKAAAIGDGLTTMSASNAVASCASESCETAMSSGMGFILGAESNNAHDAWALLLSASRS